MGVMPQFQPAGRARWCSLMVVFSVGMVPNGNNWITNSVRLFQHLQNLLEMKKTFLFILILNFIMPSIQSQVGIGTVAPHNDAMLELSSTDRGFLLPRISLTAINDPAPLNAHIAGMTIYNIAVSGTGDNMVTPGFYVNDGTQWMRTGNDARSEARWVDQPGKVVLLHLSDGGTIRPVGAELVVLDNGNIGIGTVNPSDKLT